MQYIRTVLVLARYLTKRYLTDKTALFFTFIFPLVFLFVFGGLFKNPMPSFDVALINNSSTTIANEFEKVIREQGETIKIKPVQDFEDAKLKMGRGELNAVLEIPQDFGAVGQSGLPSGDVIVHYKSSDQQTGQTFGSLIQAYLAGFNDQLVSVKAPLGVKQQAVDANNLSQFDYTFSGLLGFSLLSLGIFSMANGFTGDKKDGSLRRLSTTPLRSSQLIIATGLNRLIVGMAVTAVMFGVAAAFLDYRPSANLLSLLLFLVLSIVMLFGFGMAVSGWAKNDNQAAPLANLVSFPMMFLSGSFFPRFLMPAWLQTASTYLPLTPVIDGLRYILTEQKTLFDLGPQLAVMIGWTVIIYIIAFLTFRWE